MHSYNTHPLRTDAEIKPDWSSEPRFNYSLFPSIDNSINFASCYSVWGCDHQPQLDLQTISWKFGGSHPCKNTWSSSKANAPITLPFRIHDSRATIGVMFVTSSTISSYGSATCWVENSRREKLSSPVLIKTYNPDYVGTQPEYYLLAKNLYLPTNENHVVCLSRGDGTVELVSFTVQS